MLFTQVYSWKLQSYLSNQLLFNRTVDKNLILHYLFNLILLNICPWWLFWKLSALFFSRKQRYCCCHPWWKHPHVPLRAQSNWSEDNVYLLMDFSVWLNQTWRDRLTEKWNISSSSQPVHTISALMGWICPQYLAILWTSESMWCLV